MRISDPVRNDIIYAAISGFGAVGVAPERAAFDIIAQATGGQFWNDQDTFLVPDNYWGDLMTGAYAAVSILLALDPPDEDRPGAIHRHFHAGCNVLQQLPRHDGQGARADRGGRREKIG